MDDSVKKEIQDYLKEQNIVYLKSNKILFKKKPETGQLLPSKGAVNMFRFGINGEMSYLIQFLDIKGNVIYRLDSSPLTAFELVTEKKLIWSKTVTQNSYTEHNFKQGWRFIADTGTVEVDARELKKLGKIKVVMDQSGFKKDFYFPTYDNQIWKSILMHGYRSNFVKISAEDDVFPQVKDIVVTDYLFDISGYIANIPLLPPDNTLGGEVDQEDGEETEAWHAFLQKREIYCGCQ
ncbi:hypothetical protein ES705_46597 [subsurface metagenome]